MKLVLLMRAGEGTENPRGIHLPFFVLLWPLGWVQPARACSPCLSPDSSRLPCTGSGALGGMQVRHSTTMCSYLACVFHFHEVQK